jgi:hypothetical protein
MRIPSITIAAALLTLPACTLGSRPATFGPARSPQGIETRITLRAPRHTAATITGELLSVTDSGLLVLSADRRLLHAHWPALRYATFRQIGVRLNDGRPPDMRARERLRLVSRFPQGMSPELTARLLESLGRERVEVLLGGTAVPSDSLFLAAARTGSERYRHLDSAIADGFRLVGGDFPGMGEHWVHAGRLMAGIVDAARPAILSYARIDDRPALVGVAYAVPLGAGDPLPPAPRDAWHAHSGSVDEASFLPRHAGHDAGEPGARIAVLHAWVWLDNPDGPFATDNRALPFARAGLAQEPASAAALRALALAYGAVPFYAEAAARVSDPGDMTREEITRLLDGAAARARTAVAAHPDGLPRTELAALWKDLWEEIAALEPRAAYARDLGFAAEQP